MWLESVLIRFSVCKNWQIPKEGSWKAMYSPVTRLLMVLDILQARPQITAAEMAQRLQVNTRSVQRYITQQQDLGIPVEAEWGCYGGYRLRPGFKLPFLMAHRSFFRLVSMVLHTSLAL